MKSTLIIILIFLNYSCLSEKKIEINDVKGSWYYCDENNRYNELFINDTSLIWSPEDLPFGSHYTYFIAEDSIIKINQNGNHGARKVRIINKNQMIHSWTDTEGKPHSYEVIRINDSILTPFSTEELDKKYDKVGYFAEIFIPEFRNRLEKNGCR